MQTKRNMEETIENMEKGLNVKIKLLHLADKKTAEIIERKNPCEMEGHKAVFEKKINEIQDLKMKVMELKFMRDDEDTEAWCEHVETQTQNIYSKLTEIQNAIEELEIKKKDEKAKQEIHIEKTKLEMRRKYETSQKEATNSTTAMTTKLPKLVITKFQGNHLDWLRFWNEFETEIDKSKLAGVSKFGYLKELLVPKVRNLINGLPFNTEGYERAKAILKATYGEPSEVANAHIQCIIGLPTITHHSIVKIHEFYEKLITNTQSLETMGKLIEIKGYARMTLDKLPTIRANLVILDDNWKDWGFPELLEALRKWTARNPRPTITDTREERRNNSNKMYQIKQANGGRYQCVYCSSDDHKPWECQKVKDLGERKKIITTKHLCFNCLREGHRASQCKAKRGCYYCGQRHHSSICSGNDAPKINSTGNSDDEKQATEKAFSASSEENVIFPVMVVKVNGIKCRAMLDSGSGSSYVSSTIIDKIKAKPLRKERRNIEMLMHTTTKQVSIYKLDLTNMDGSFQMDVEASKVEKKELLTLPNAHYKDLIQKYKHLRGIQMIDEDPREELPIHVILGTGEASRVKTTNRPRVGEIGEPTAEYTRFGWVIMSPGKDCDTTNLFMTKSSTNDYDRLCQYDVLGVQDPTGEESVYHEFKDQLRQSKDGWYETGFIWKPGHPDLPTNYNGSRARLTSLLKRLKTNPALFKEYDDIMREQIKLGFVEKVEKPEEIKGYYLPHRAVIREEAETTKVRVVYDASAKANANSPSLNDCLETGPPLQNLLWSILVKTRFQPVILSGDIKKAFLQVRVRESDRDYLRFHWIKDVNSDELETFRFTRVVVGLTQSPFLLGGTMEMHLEHEKEVSQTPEIIEEIGKSAYVDDFVTGGNTQEEVQKVKEVTIDVFKKAGFELHKWHSNIPRLEMKDDRENVKHEQLDCKILGVPWNKKDDTLSVAMPSKTKEDVTKREILKTLASIYDPLGLISPVTLRGKLIYRAACDEKVAWDEPLSKDLMKRWENFKQTLKINIAIPRSIAIFKEILDYVDLHAFADASKDGTSAVLYAVIKQQSGFSQGLMASNSRLSKKETTIPRLELTACHMAANLIENASQVLSRFPLRNSYAWSDSKVALHWIKGEGEYKQYVSNRVRKIRERKSIVWRHVPGTENPADIGSRGSSIGDLKKLWFNGPSWISSENQWPEDIMTKPTEVSEVEAKLTKTVLAVAKSDTNAQDEDALSQLMVKYSYKKALRTTAWLMRFAKNCRMQKKDRDEGPLTTQEIMSANDFWIRQTQRQAEEKEEFKSDQANLNLEKIDQIYRCKGRIQGEYPIYIPNKSEFARKLVMNAHLMTLHGGVGMTMTHIREKYWIPKLRQLTKTMIRSCHGCQRFRAIAFKTPTTGQLPKDRTEGDRPFQIVGLDFAGPFTYKKKITQEGKAYIMLICDSLTRALYLEVLSDQTFEEFLKCLKRFIARRGRPKKIYSDNFSTFVKASKWIKKVLKDERLHDYLASTSIKWQFNLSKAPWWGGQFERMVGIMKQSLYKTIGKTKLSFEEMEDVLLDVEITLNNRPLSYVEDDIQLPILTPNSLIYNSSLIPEEDPDNIEETDIRKRAKFIKKCKEMVWNRWRSEYLTGLRERHKIIHGKDNKLKVGDVVIIKGDERNRALWKIGIVDKLLPGKDDVVRAVRLRAGKSFLERSVQHLYPLELDCDWKTEAANENCDAKNEKRPIRNTAAIAKLKIGDQAELEDMTPKKE